MSSRNARLRAAGAQKAIGLVPSRAFRPRVGTTLTVRVPLVTRPTRPRSGANAA